MKLIMGLSNADGFMIKLKRGREEKTFYTKNYKRGEENKEKYFKKVSFACLLIVIISSFFLAIELPLAMWDIIAASLIPCVYLTTFVAQLLNTKVRRWHCCEHKVANLISGKKEISKESFRAESFYNELCGSINKLKSFIPTVLYICLRITGKEIIISLPITVLFYIVLLLFNRAIMTKIGVSYLFQMIFTRKPEEKMCDDAIALAQEIYQWKNH